MPNLSAKELSGLSDQLAFEKVICAKYQAAVQETEDAQLKTSFQQYADQHRQNYNCLLNFLQ
ncbi:PA2169 family four-helix-bundle protein [Vermiculatibacterium agrestimuris]|uniref:PA2169 family four-helix-bundle protein n=1 Tax=Vermiculatibacterium agrestimuris TaxID=2941519 RepID=UPI00203F60D1|nr:PA2169 family four-helix-bundle protein [Vermiculatibacterium agrestimuris]